MADGQRAQRKYPQMTHSRSQPKLIHPFNQRLIPVNSISSVTPEHCCDRRHALLSLSFLSKGWVSATSDPFCYCEFSLWPAGGFSTREFNDSKVEAD